MSKGEKVEQFLREIPVHSRPRRLADWLNPTDARKVHSLIHEVSAPREGCRLYAERPVNLVQLIPSIAFQCYRVFVKAVCGKTARTVWAADGG